MKINQEQRRKLRRRYKLKQRNYDKLPRLSIFRSNKHIYVQIIDDIKACTLVSCSSIEKDLKSTCKGYNISGAKMIGEIIAKKALAKEIKRVIFDIGSYKYHGKVKTLIETVISCGLNQNDQLCQEKIENDDQESQKICKGTK
jgi:large subunit ribosomal protein L18